MRGLAAFAAVVVVAGPASAATQCFSRETALAAIKEKFGEVPAFAGDSSSGTMTITLNTADGSWTVWMAPVPRLLCPIVSGRHWRVDAP